MLGPPELLVLALIIALVFGASKIPEVSRAVGRSKGEFERGLIESETVTEGDE